MGVPMIRRSRITGWTVIPAPEPNWVEEMRGPTNRRWKMRFISNNYLQDHFRITGENYVDGEFISNYIQYIPLASLEAKKGKKMNDKNIETVDAEDLPWVNTDAVDIQSDDHHEGDVISIQTAEDVGPKDETMPAQSEPETIPA